MGGGGAAAAAAILFLVQIMNGPAFFFICFVSRSRNTSRARVKHAMSSSLVSE